MARPPTRAPAAAPGAACGDRLEEAPDGSQEGRDPRALSQEAGLPTEEVREKGTGPGTS